MGDMSLWYVVADTAIVKRDFLDSARGQELSTLRAGWRTNLESLGELWCKLPTGHVQEGYRLCRLALKQCPGGGPFFDGALTLFIYTSRYPTVS